MWRKVFFYFLALLFFFPPALQAQIDLLSKEERLWLSNRNNTIVVYPEKNNPPFVYIPNAAAAPVGLSIQYLKLIAEKVGATLIYLPAKSRAQVLSDVLEGKGDVIVRSDQGSGLEEANLRYTEAYSSVPVVLVVRRDSGMSNVTLTELAGKRVAATSGSGAAQFIHENYPRVVLYQLTDDEIGLQQLLLGEVDVLVVDSVSLSYLLSRQTLSAVKIAGHAGFSYELAFAVPKEKAILQSILDKGLTQVSAAERRLLAEQWTRFPLDELSRGKTWFGGKQTLLIVGGIICGALLVLFVIFLLAKQRHRMFRLYARLRRQEEAKEKLEELAAASTALQEELQEIKALEHEVAAVLTETKEEKKEDQLGQ